MSKPEAYIKLSAAIVVNPVPPFPTPIAEPKLAGSSDVKFAPLKSAKYVEFIAGILPVASTIPTLPEPACIPPATSKAAAPVSDITAVLAIIP